ncbi:hypothetical protein [Aquimarina amphilecti]|nr:hypothetical protein [Aquimarina amphilecti]
MIRKIVTFTLILISLTSTYSQNNSLFERLRAIKTSGSLTFYNVDGIAITSESMIYSYNDINLKMAYNLYNVSSEKKEKNITLRCENLFTRTKNVRSDKITQYNSYFFVKNKNNKVIVFHFGSINKTNKDFEIDFINLVIDNKIPKSCFSDRPINKINFASRIIEIEDNCNYANVNSIQCPFNGQMSWSLHENLSDAKKQVEYEFEITKSKKLGQLVKEEMINLNFEGINTIAKRVTFVVENNDTINIDLKSIEGKKLIIYYIAEKVRSYNISCVLSHWEDDKIASNGLPTLLSKIIQL